MDTSNNILDRQEQMLEPQPQQVQQGVPVNRTPSDDNNSTKDGVMNNNTPNSMHRNSTSHQNNHIPLQGENNEPSSLMHGRITELERRLIMFENMFHALSGKLDQHFKKYDVIIQSQQQQIKELNSIVSTLLNDQVRNAEILRDKLSNSVSGISAQSNLITGVPNTHQHQTHHNNTQINQQQQQSSLQNDFRRRSTLAFSQPGTEEFFEDMLNNDNISMANDPSTTATTNRTTSTINNNSTLGRQADKVSSMQQIDTHPHITFMDKQPAIIKESYHPTSDPTRKASMEIEYPAHVTEYNNHTSVAIPSQHLPQSNGNTTITYLNKMVHTNPDDNVTLKFRNNGVLPIHNFQFIKSPHSVREIWLEYVEGIKGRPSIKEMENIYHSSWRREPAVTKRYARRKVLCKAIETGLKRGYDLENIINVLENHRIVDHEKGTKQPLGWLCQPANIPQAFK